MSVMDDRRRRKPTPEELEAQEVQEEIERKQQLDDLKWLMGHAEGKRIAARVISQTHVYHLSFNTSGTQMSFNEGERNIGLWFVTELSTAAPDKFVQLFKDLQGK